MYNFFSIFENGDYAANQVYFYVSNANNSKNTCVNSAYAQQRFHFQKITGTLKNIFFCCKYKPSVHFKEQSPKRKF